MNNWIPKSKIVKFAAAAALLSIILYLVSLIIIFDKIEKIENFYQTAESESFKEEKFWAIKSIAENNKELIQTLTDFFTQKGDEVKFIERIEEIARASSVKFEIIHIEVKANQKDSFKEDVSIKMKLEGSWASIMDFISKLERTSFGISIKKVDLDANTPGNWFGFIDFIVFREK